MADFHDLMGRNPWVKIEKEIDMIKSSFLKGSIFNIFNRSEDAFVIINRLKDSIFLGQLCESDTNSSENDS